jgi:L-cystine uptake protein TcyP (sodium:dicarboxylate symporter family)
MGILTQLVQWVLGLGIGMLGLQMMEEAQGKAASSPLEALLFQFLSVVFPVVWMSAVVWFTRPTINKRLRRIRHAIILGLQLLVIIAILIGCAIPKTVDTIDQWEPMFRAQLQMQEYDKPMRKRTRVEKGSHQLFFAFVSTGK